MWTIAKIEEADYGCEERLPGEPRMLLITLEMRMELQFSSRLRKIGLRCRCLSGSAYR
jgi:hypothetical protein